MRYKLGKLLFQGGTADIYIALCVESAETVVVKLLRDAHLEENRRWFRRQIRILEQEVAPEMVRIIEADATGPRPFIAMPYYKGGSLTQWAGKLRHEQILAIARQCASALLSLHTCSIAHGDFKPDNILLTADGFVRVADPLGNGRGCTVMLGTNHGGTPGYWAPEVLRGGPISAAADVFSFAATMHHLITGRRPKDGHSLDPGVRCEPTLRALVLAASVESERHRPGMWEIRNALFNNVPVTWSPPKEKADNDSALAFGALAALGLLFIIAAASDG